MQLLVYFFVFTLLWVLALTFGIFNQIWETLFKVADDLKTRTKTEEHAITKSALLSAAGVCHVFGLPFFIVNAPFEAVGVAWAVGKGQGDRQKPLIQRLAGTGALVLFVLLLRTGVFPHLGKGFIWLFAMMTGFGGEAAAAEVTNTTNATVSRTHLKGRMGYVSAPSLSRSYSGE